MDSAGRRPHSSAFSQQDHKKILNGHEIKKGSNGHEVKKVSSGHEPKKGLSGHELKKAPNGHEPKKGLSGHEHKKAPNGQDLKKVLNGQDLLTRGAHRRFSTAPRVASKIQFLKKLKLKERDQQPLVLLQRLEQYIANKFIRQLYTWGSLTVLKTTNNKPKPRRKKLEIFKVVSSEYYKEKNVPLTNKNKERNVPLINKNKERNVPLTNKNFKPDAKVEENGLFESNVEKKLTDFSDSKISITNSFTSKQKLTHKNHSTSKNSKCSTSRQNSKDITISSSKIKRSSEFHNSERQNPKFRSSSDRLRQPSKSSNYFSDRPKHSSRLSDCYRDKSNPKFKDCGLDRKDSKSSVSSLITKYPNVCSTDEVITSSDDCFRNKQGNSKSEVSITNKEISDTDICSHDKINSKYSVRSLDKVNPNLNKSSTDILKTESSVSFPDKLNSKSSVCSPDTLISKSSENSYDKVNSISSNSSTNKLKTKPKLCFTNKIHLKSSVCSSDQIKNDVQSLNKQNSEFSAIDNQISKLSTVSNEKLNSETFNEGFTDNVNSKSSVVSAVNSKSNLSAVDKCNAKPISSVFVDRSEQNLKRFNSHVVAEASSITSCAEFNNSDVIDTSETTKTINNNNKNNYNTSFLNNKYSNKITAMKNNIPESVYNNNNNNANSNNNNNSKRNTCSFIKSSITYFNYNSKYRPVNPYPVSDDPDTASSLMKPMPELESFSEDTDLSFTGSNGKEDKSAVSFIEEDNSNSANISSDGHVTNISKKGSHTNISNDDHVTNIHIKDRRTNIFRKDGNTNISENDNNTPVGLCNEDKIEIENEGEIFNDHSFICASSHQPNNQKFDAAATTPVEAPANENNICCSSAVAAAAAATNNGSSSHKCDSARRDESKHSRTQSGRPNSPTFECRKKESPRSDTGIPKIILYVKGKGPDKQYTCASNIPTKTSDSVIMPSKGLVSNHSAKKIVKSLKIKSEDSEDKNNKVKVNINNEQCDKSIVNNDSSLKIEDDMPVAIPIEDSDKDDNERKRLEENISNATNDSSSNHSFSDSLPDLELLADQCEDSHSRETKKNDSQTDKIKINEADTLIRGSKISLSTYKNLGKPTAHVEPYIAEPTLRSSSRKGKGFYDEDIPFLIEQEEPDIYEIPDFEEQSKDPKNEPSTLNSVPDWDEYSENPQNEYSKSPQNEYSKSPQNEYSKSPQNEFSKSPQNEFSKSPQIEYLKSPQSEYSRSPHRRSKNIFSHSSKEFSKKSPNEYSNQHDKYSESIQNEYCESPNNEYVKNSNKYSKSFHNIYSKSPADEYLSSHVNHSNFVSSYCDKTTEEKTLRTRSSSQLSKCLCQKSGEISDPVPNCPVHKMGMLSPLGAEKSDEDTTNSISSLPRYNSCVSDGEIKKYPTMNTFLSRQHTQENKMEYYTPNLYREMCNHEATAEEKFLINCPRSLKRLSRIRNLNSSSKERPRSLSIDSALSLFTVRVENSALMFPLKKSSSLINFKPNHYMSCSTIRRESVDQTTTTTTTSSSSVPSEGETSGGEESEMYVIENKSDFYLDVQDEVVKFDWKQNDSPLEPENENPQQQNPPPHKRLPNEKIGLQHPPDDKGLKRTLKQMRRERKKLKNKEKNMEQNGAQDPDNGGSNSKIGTNLPEKKIRKKNKRITEQGDASDQEVKKYVEREKGFRLAQEIPGFNWLEEKIRNSTIPILPGIVTTTASTTYTTCVTTFVTNTTALVTQNVCAVPNKATRSLSSPAATPDSTQMVQAKSMPELLPATEYVPIKQSMLTMPREMTQSVKSPPETIKIRANFGGTNLFIPATRGSNSLISTTGGVNTIIPSANGSTLLIPSSNFIIPTTGMAISTTGISIAGPGNNISVSGINIPGSGINIPGSGINIPGSGINIPGSGINIPGSGINIPGSGINIPGSGINIPGSGINIPGSGINIPGSGINIPGSGISISSTGVAIPSTGICITTTGVPIGSNHQFVKELHRQHSEPKDLFRNGQIDVITCEPKSFMHLQTAVTQLAPTLKALPKLRPSPPNSSNNLLPITTTANTTINTTAQDKTISSNLINPPCAPRPHYTSSVITSTASYNPLTRADVTTLSSTISQPVTAPAVQKRPINVHETQPESNRSKTGEEKSKIFTDKCLTAPVPCDTENSSPMEIEESDSGNAEKSFGPKLSILKEAFKNKLSVLQDDPVESVSPDSSKKSEVDKPIACEASTSQVVPQEKVISSNKVGQSTSDIKCDEPRKLSEGSKGFADLIEEVEKPVLISIPETLPSIESVLSGIKVGDGMQENILGKTVNKEFETQSLFAALYEELLKTRKEVEKLRKMQEQMLQSDVMKKSVQKVDPKSESEDDHSIKSEPLVIDITIGDNSQPSTEKVTSEPKSGRDSATKRTSESLKEPAEPKFIYKVLGAEGEKPHPEPFVQDEYGNPKKKFKSGNEGVTKHYSDVKHDHQEGGHIDARKSDPHNSRLRDLLGISNSELDVVPIEESVTFQSVLSARVPTTSTVPTSTNQDTSTITSCSSSMQPTSLYYTKEPDRLRVVVPVSQEYVNSLNTHQRRSVGEIPSLIPSTPPVRRCSEDYGREHDSRLMKLATALPNSTLRPKHFGGHPAGPPQGVIVSDHSRMQLQANRHHIRPTIMTVSEPQPLMSHHPLPILTQSQAKFMNDRRVIMQKSHQPPQPDLNMDGERKIYVQQYVSPPPNPGRDLHNGGMVSNVGMKNLQTVQTFQPKIIIPPDKEMSSSSIDLNPNVQNALQESGLQNPGIPISIGLQNSGLTGGLLNSQSNLSSMPSVSHSFSNIVKRPSAFTSNQNYSYKQNPSSARLAEIFPIVQQQHPMSSNQGKSYHQIQSQPPSHISDQHYGSQQIIQVDRSTGNVISTQHGPVPLSPKISQSHGHGQFYPPHSLSQKIMHHTPLVHTVPPHTYPHSSQVHPSYNLGQHRPNAQLVEGSLQHSGNYLHDQHNSGSPNRPHIISPSLPKHRPPNLPQGYPNISNYQGPPVSSKQISPNQSHSPNRISPHMQSPSGYPNRIQIPMQISPHHPSNQTRMNPPPPYRVPSPTKPLMVNHHQKMMMQQQADAQGHTNPSVIAGARKPYPNEKQIQMVQVHPMANGVRDAGDYSNQSPNSVGASNSSPTSTSKKKCLICPQSAQFLCSGCKTAWYCSKECQRQHWALHSPSCVIRR